MESLRSVCVKRIIHIRHLQDQSNSFNAMVDFRMSFFKYAVWLNLSFYMYLVLLFSLLFFFSVRSSSQQEEKRLVQR